VGTKSDGDIEEDEVVRFMQACALSAREGVLLRSLTTVISTFGTAASRSGGSATAVILCFDCLHNGISLYVNVYDDDQLHSS
jgi:hypothetical protein